MKKSFISLAFVSLFSFGFTASAGAQNKTTASKVGTLAAVTENVLAITGTSTGNETVDHFLKSTASLLEKYKTVNTTLSAFQILKEGTSRSITKDGQVLTKLAALGQLSGISKQLTTLGGETTKTASTGTELLKSLIAEKSKTMESKETVTKVETAMAALNLLGTEIPQSVQNTASLLAVLKKL